MRHADAMRTHTAAAALAATMLLTLTACSTSSDEKPDANKAALLAAVTAYTADFFKPDAAGTYALLSARCQKTTSVADMKKILAASMLAYGTPKVKSTEVNQLDGNMARVTVHYVKPPMPEKPQSWTRERGGWKFDDC